MRYKILISMLAFGILISSLVIAGTITMPQQEESVSGSSGSTGSGGLDKGTGGQDKGAGTAYYDCEDGQQKPCPKQAGLCYGSTQDCINGDWAGCSALTYLSYNSDYEQMETTCDGIDNDCDGQIDENLNCGCIDTDGGRNYDVKGTCTDGVKCKGSMCNDGCQKSKILGEWFCKEGTCVIDEYICPDGCSNGACTGIVEDEALPECLSYNTGSLFSKGHVSLNHDHEDSCRGTMTVYDYRCNENIFERDFFYLPFGNEDVRFRLKDVDTGLKKISIEVVGKGDVEEIVYDDGLLFYFPFGGSVYEGLVANLNMDDPAILFVSHDYVVEKLDRCERGCKDGVCYENDIVANPKCVASGTSDPFTKGYAMLNQKYYDRCVTPSVLYDFQCNENIFERDFFYLPVEGKDIQFRLKKIDTVQNEVWIYEDSGSGSEDVAVYDSLNKLSLYNEGYVYKADVIEARPDSHIRFTSHDYVVIKETPCKNGCYDGACRESDAIDLIELAPSAYWSNDLDEKIDYSSYAEMEYAEASKGFASPISDVRTTMGREIGEGMVLHPRFDSGAFINGALQVTIPI